MTNDQTGRTPRQTTGGSPAASTIMIIVTVVAVVIGFFILKSIRDDDSGSSVRPPTTNGSGASSTTSTPTSVITPPTTVAGDVKTGSSVQVANASGVGGAAGKLTTDLKTAGFTTGKATDATGEKLDTTVVYYADAAAQPVAATVARSMGVGEPAAMPSPIPVTGGKLEDGVGVLVMLGKDKAGKNLTAMTTTTAAGAATPSSVAGGSSTSAG